MNVIVSARRAFGSVTKYRTMIGTTSKKVAIAMLRLVTTHDRRRSLKCLNLSYSCGDRRCEESVSKATIANGFDIILPLRETASGCAAA
jgi:hypothetical protein